MNRLAGEYVLICEYVHCFGRISHERGTVTSEAEARIWAEENAAQDGFKGLPSCDPIRRCPVTACPSQLQKPRYTYRKI